MLVLKAKALKKHKWSLAQFSTDVSALSSDSFACLVDFINSDGGVGVGAFICV